LPVKGGGPRGLARRRPFTGIRLGVLLCRGSTLRFSAGLMDFFVRSIFRLADAATRPPERTLSRERVGRARDTSLSLDRSVKMAVHRGRKVL